MTDTAGLLTPDRVAALEAKLARYEAETGHQLAVLVVDSTGDEPIESFALQTAMQAQLGRKGIDDGALLVVAKSDRRARIEVGYGLEGAIPDVIAKRVIEELLVPRFRTGDFAGGIDAATDALMRAARGEAMPAPKRSPAARRSVNDPIGLVLFLAVLSTMIGAPFRRGMRPLGALLGGAAAGTIAWFLLHVALWSAAAFALGALLGFVGPTSGMRRGGPFGGYGGGYGGGWGGGFGGGGGGGGFGGGGGSFGGGGASGSW